MAAPADDSDGTTRVLIVDDEQNVADLYATWVEMSSDYEVEVAYDGPDAVAAVVGDDDIESTAAVDAVLLDRRMPGMSGDEVIQELRDRGYDVPVAMVTAVKLEDAPLDANYQEYLTKPVMRDDVSRVVRTLVEYDDAMDTGSDDETTTEDDTTASAAEPAESVESDDGATADEGDDGEASDEVRSTLDSVSQKLDQIQSTVGGEDDEEAENEGERDEDSALDGGDGLVTGEDIEQQIGTGGEADTDRESGDDGE